MGAWLLDQTTGKSLFFDVVTSEEPTFPSEVTEHPVEVGANVTDHVRVGLNTMTLEVFVTNEPIAESNQWGGGGLVTETTRLPEPGEFQPTRTGTENITVKEWFSLPIGIPILGALTAGEQDVPMVAKIGMDGSTVQPVAVKTLRMDNVFDAVGLTMGTLVLMRDKGHLVTVYASKGVFKNMVIESVTMTRNADTGTGAEITIQLKQIIQVTTATVAAPSIPRADVKKDGGQQAPAPADFSSLSKTIGGWFSGTATPPQTVQP